MNHEQRRSEREIQLRLYFAGLDLSLHSSSSVITVSTEISNSSQPRRKREA
jgi:hypothetical protein